MKQKELSVWLRVVVVLIGVAVVFLGAVFLPMLGGEAAGMNPELSWLFWPCLLYLWATILPVLAALVLAWLIFAEIGRDNSFCMANARRLRAISILALVDTLLYIVWMVGLGLLGVLHPSVLIGSVCIVFMGVGFTVGAAALSHLAQKAAALKDENDLVI
jgi:hypothetical protein